jgi:hypothetical protein
MKVLVSSFGGVGTSPFLSWLSSKMLVNCPRDSDGLKHIPNPNQVVIGADKCIFIIGDPIEALISLYNRKFIRPQMRKLTGQDFNVSIDEYADSGTDLIKYYEQFESWMTFRNKDVLFLTYPYFWEYENQIKSYVGLPMSVSFFTKKERESKKEALSKDTLMKLDQIYAPLNERINKVGKFFISEKEGSIE